MLSTFSTELQLLCACGSVKLSEELHSAQAALAPTINPHTLLELATRHRVIPMLYHHLSQHAPGVFPHGLLEALKKRATDNVLYSLQSLQINVQLMQLLRDHDIPYLPLKGVTVAQRYYGSISLRQARDIDFWIPPCRIRQVRDLLLAHSYHPDEIHDFGHIAKRGRRHRQFIEGYCHHDVFLHPSGVPIEVHWRLCHNPEGLRIDPWELLQKGEIIQIGTEALTVIEPLALLLYLCDHGSRHGWYRLKWLFDLPQLLDSQDWDWDLLLCTARKANCSTTLLLGLGLAHELCGWDIPGKVREIIQLNPSVRREINIVCCNLQRPIQTFTRPTVLQSLGHLCYRIRLTPSFTYVVHELGSLFLTPSGLCHIRLPDSCFWGYYLLHPFILIWRQIRRWLAYD